LFSRYNNVWYSLATNINTTHFLVVQYWTSNALIPAWSMNIVRLRACIFKRFKTSLNGALIQLLSWSGSGREYRLIVSLFISVRQMEWKCGSDGCPWTWYINCFMILGLSEYSFNALNASFNTPDLINFSMLLPLITVLS